MAFFVLWAKLKRNINKSETPGMFEMSNVGRYQIVRGPLLCCKCQGWGASEASGGGPHKECVLLVTIHELSVKFHSQSGSMTVRLDVLYKLMYANCKLVVNWSMCPYPLHDRMSAKYTLRSYQVPLVVNGNNIFPTFSATRVLEEFIIKTSCIFLICINIESERLMWAIRQI